MTEDKSKGRPSQQAVPAKSAGQASKASGLWSRPSSGSGRFTETRKAGNAFRGTKREN